MPELVTPEQEGESDGQEEDLGPDEVEVRVGLVRGVHVTRIFRTSFGVPGAVSVDH